MNTFRQLARKPETVPAVAAWDLADIAESRGRQELFNRQVPQRLKALREHAIIESAVSSNRIDGVEVQERVLAGHRGLVGSASRRKLQARGYTNFALRTKKWGNRLGRARCRRVPRAGEGRQGRMRGRLAGHMNILVAGGVGIHWPKVDEDISVEGMLHGTPARRRPRSATPAP